MAASVKLSHVTFTYCQLQVCHILPSQGRKLSQLVSVPRPGNMLVGGVPDNLHLGERRSPEEELLLLQRFLYFGSTRPSAHLMAAVSHTNPAPAKVTTSL